MGVSNKTIGELFGAAETSVPLGPLPSAAQTIELQGAAPDLGSELAGREGANLIAAGRCS